ncbi:MAG: hypothetical protein ACLUQ6_00890 [Alistipes onderdonkii]
MVHDERRARALLDVSTGSGCIAASLALALPAGRRFARPTLSDAALAIAAENCRTLGARVTLRKADALGGLDEIFPGPFEHHRRRDPPYVPQSEPCGNAPQCPGVRTPRGAVRPRRRRAAILPAPSPAPGGGCVSPGGKLYFEIYRTLGRADAPPARRGGIYGHRGARRPQRKTPHRYTAG